VKIGRHRSSPKELLTLEVEVHDEPFAYVDHTCAGADGHRLLGIALSERERALLRGGRPVSVLVACDRCLWERRLLLLLAE
jgi:hypothetical protein